MLVTNLPVGEVQLFEEKQIGIFRNKNSKKFVIVPIDFNFPEIFEPYISYLLTSCRSTSSSMSRSRRYSTMLALTKCGRMYAILSKFMALRISITIDDSQ